MKILQQTIFGTEEEIITQIPVYVFRSVKDKTRYLASDIEHIDFSHPEGDVVDLIDKLVHFNKDYSKPNYNEAKTVPVKIHGDAAQGLYEPELRYLTITEFNELAEEYGFDPFQGMSI